MKIDIHDKDLLLEEYDKEQQKEINLSFKQLLLAFLSMFVAFMIIIPGVYIKNKIYYISRDIGKLYEQDIVLREENKKLKRKIEAIQFKNQILNNFLDEESE